MNSLAARAPTPPVRADQQASANPHDAAHASQHKAVFERVLRDKASSHDSGTAATSAAHLDAPPDAGSCACANPMPQFLLAAGATTPSVVAPVVNAALSSPSAMVTGAALGADATPPSIAGSGFRPESAWEVSLPQAMGVTIEVRATRLAASPLSEAPATWKVAIASSTAHAAVLVHHAPRLNERLRTRALISDHVRIQSEEDAS